MTNLFISDDFSSDELPNRRLLGLPVGTKNIMRSRSGFLSPIVFVIFVFAFLVWLVFEIPHILPARSEPPPFLWHSRLSRNVSSYIRPGRDTSLLNPKNKCSPNTRILFMVPSAVNNSYQRESIRRTWGMWVLNETKHLSSQSKAHARGSQSDLKLVFILGKDEKWTESRVSARIFKENQIHGDLLVEDFIDSYTNLTLKSIFMLKWVDMKCPNVKFIMKADDDMFINVKNLDKVLSDPKLKTPLLMGSLICNAHPIKNRWSKWYSPAYMFSGKYPNYLSGTAYVISGDLIKRLFNAALQTPYFHLEDVFLTGVCAKKVGVRPVAQKGFSFFKRAFNPCIYKDIITGHEVSVKEMRNLWNMMHNSSILDKCKPISKSVLAPPSSGKCIWK